MERSSTGDSFSSLSLRDSTSFFTTYQTCRILFAATFCIVTIQTVAIIQITIQAFQLLSHLRGTSSELRSVSSRMHVTILWYYCVARPELESPSDFSNLTADLHSILTGLPKTRGQFFIEEMNALQNPHNLTSQETTMSCHHPWNSLSSWRKLLSS